MALVDQASVKDASGATIDVRAITALGRGAATASRSIATCTEDKAVLDAIAASLVAIDTGIPAALGQGAMAASQPVVIASDQSAVPVKTSIATVSVEFTRPSNTDIYAVNDVVGNTGTAAVINFADIFSANGASGYLVRAQLFTDQVANVAAYRLYLYNEAPTAIADNSQFTLLYANAAKQIGFIDFSALTTEGTGSDTAYSLVSLSLSAKASAAYRDIYGVLITKTIFTPASAQKYTIRLMLDQN